MEILFTIPENDTIDGSNFIEYYPSVNRNLYWKNILPYIKQAQMNFIIDEIGQPLLDKLLSAVAKPAAVDSAMEYLRFAAAYHTVYLSMPHLNVTLSDAGVMQSAGENQSRTNQWSYKAARWSALFQAHKNLDNAINILIQNIDDPYLSEYSESEYHDNSKSRIFDSSSMKQYASVQTWRAFKAILPYLRRAENKLMEMLGDRTFDLLFDATPLNRILLDKARWYVATEALLDAVPNLSIYIEGNNITVMSSLDGIENGIGVFSPPQVELVDKLIQKLTKETKIHRNDVLSFLRINRNHFVEWAEDFAETKTRTVYHSEDQIGGIIL
jgi:hypothetical protein